MILTEKFILYFKPTKKWQNGWVNGVKSKTYTDEELVISEIDDVLNNKNIGSCNTMQSYWIVCHYHDFRICSVMS
jgi:hypothetical protein